jgi:hypothetical protein
MSHPPVSPTTVASAFVAGTALGLVTSGGIVEERLSTGNPIVALAVNAAVSGAAILLLALFQRRLPLSPALFVSQTLGAAISVLLVHVAVRSGFVVAPYWLAERPPQLVNDAVAVVSTLLLVWACARRFDLRFLIGALALVTAYRVTSRFWHLDLPPHPFALRVQDIVLLQFTAAAIALPLYRQATRARRMT